MEFLSIGTLMSFTMVAASVIILRYQPVSSCQFKLKPESEAPTPGDPPPDASDKQSMLKQSQVNNLWHIHTARGMDYKQDSERKTD